MALNNSTADACATAIHAAIQAAGAGDGLAQWKAIMETIYSRLKSDIDITITAHSIVTTGNSSTQSGPQANDTIHPG